jgi:Flp pilus assembly protein TadG
MALKQRILPRVRQQRLRASLSRDEGGTVAIEFAIVLVLLLTVMFGIIAFGFQFATHIALSYAVSEGGRSAVAGLTSTERQQLATDAVNRVLTSFSPLIDPTKATVGVTSEGQTAEGEAIQVAITYSDNRFDIFPFVPAFNATSTVETTFFVADPSS